jgi:UDP-N-acetylglucosamine:LPS N-acetylglucosamine transferase
MSGQKLLFISGSVGLGHVGRDLAIVNALRNIEPDVDVFWLAEDPAAMVITQAGERLLPEAKFLAHGNAELSNSAEGYNANLVRWVMNMRKGWAANAKMIAEIVERENFDLVVGDEAYDLIIERTSNPNFKRFPFMMIYDLIGVDSVSRNPVDVVAAYMINRLWANALRAKPPLTEKNLFIGEVEDIPDRKFGFVLPNRRELARKHVDFVGYVLSFDPDEYRDKAKIRKLLGYGEEPLVICSIGGTSAGKELLDLCAKAYPIMRKELPNLRMLLVCGPLLSPDLIKVQEGVEVKGFVPELFKHLAAADLCIVTGGGTITLELTALRQPFLYFPLQKHFEQEIEVVLRCRRHNAGVGMDYSKTTPESLAKEALSNMGKKTNYAQIPTSGAENTAVIISQILKEY